MESLEQYSEQQGYRSGQYASQRFILKDPEALAIFMEVAKEAEKKYISDTVAAKYLIKNYKQFNHLKYNTVRRYFADYRSGNLS